MTTDRSSRALSIFEQALDVNEHERANFVASSCGDDKELLARVQQMLDADARPHVLLDGSREALVSAMTPSPGRGFGGRKLGPYTIRREVGRGGMGVVYEAERQDVGMRVALKRISSSLASAERVARFHYERRVLAILEHQNIARFLDAGVADDETPWLAMEFVSGQSINEYCDERRLSVHDRLILFEKVGEAVAHAHRNLLVHRDLKPSNVLVSEDGEPKLVDFGIAKLLADEIPGQRTVTHADAPPMTPDYASPEQLIGDPITTASDVYQMGILLFELLTGRRPTRRGGNPLTFPRDAHAVEPLRPSSVITSKSSPDDPRTPEERCLLRGTTPDRLRHQLEGDLDNIIQMAMRVEPHRRYASAQEMVDDIRRYRAGLPVVARPGSLAYRVKKFVSRHKMGVAMLASVLILLVGATLVFNVQARRVTRERDRAEQMALMFERLIRYADPTAVQRDSLASQAVVDQAAAAARAGVVQEPEVWAHMLVVLGHVYRNIGLHDTAMTIWSEVIDALEPVAPAHHPDLLEAVSSLGVARVDAGDFEGGFPLLERALGNARQLDTPRRAELAAALVDMGFGKQVAGDDAAASEIYAEAKQVLESMADSGGRDYERLLINLGYIADRRHDHRIAESNFRLALERRLRVYGPTYAGTLNAKASLARTLLHQEKVDEADRLSLEVLNVHRAQFPEPHRNLAGSLDLRGLVLAAMTQFDEAVSHARQAVAMFRSTVGNDHINVAFATANLGRILSQQGEIEDAESFLRGAVDLYTRIVGENHPAALSARANLARAQHQLGKWDAAEGNFVRALPALDSLWNGRPALTLPLSDFGNLLADLNRCDEAVRYFRRAVSLARREWPDDHPNVVAPETGLARCGAGPTR